MLLDTSPGLWSGWDLPAFLLFVDRLRKRARPPIRKSGDGGQSWCIRRGGLLRSIENEIGGFGGLASGLDDPATVVAHFQNG